MHGMVGKLHRLRVSSALDRTTNFNRRDILHLVEAERSFEIAER